MENNATDVRDATQVTDNIDRPNEGVDFEPLFESENVTEAQLRGEESTGEETATPEPKAEETAEASKGLEKTEETKPEEKAEETEKKAEPEQKAEPEKKSEAKPEEKAKPEKPPEGYVPHQALHQERQTVKELRAENARLTAELEKASTKEPADAEEFKDFKVLSEAEFRELMEDDPDEATLYQYKFTKYQSHQREVQERQLAEKRAVDAERAILDKSLTDINQMLPGIYEGKNEMVGRLVDFASELGVHPTYLAAITDPTTQLRTKSGQSMLLGPGAVQMVSLVKNAFEKISAMPNEAKLRETIEAEVRAKIENELKAELMKKFQTNPEQDFVSLDQVAGSGERKTGGKTGILTESDFARASEAEQRAWLGG